MYRVFYTKQKMNKNEYLIQLLETLKWVWTPAEWFLVVMKAGGFDESLVDTLIALITEAIKSASSEIEQKKLSWSLAVLTKIKSLEDQSNEKDEEECERLLVELDMIS